MREHCVVLSTCSGCLRMCWIFCFAWNCHSSLRFFIRLLNLLLSYCVQQMLDVRHSLMHLSLWQTVTYRMLLVFHKIHLKQWNGRVKVVLGLLLELKRTENKWLFCSTLTSQQCCVLRSDLLPDFSCFKASRLAVRTVAQANHAGKPLFSWLRKQEML